MITSTITTIGTVRRENLRELIRDSNGPSGLSTKLGHSNPSFLSQLAGPKPTRDISEKTARKIEQLLGLSNGWMDRVNTGITYSKSIQNEDTAFDDVHIDERRKNPHLNIDKDRLTACLDCILERAIGMSHRQIAALTSFIYSSHSTIDELPEVAPRLIELSRTV